MHKKILIVDDDTGISDSLAMLLREEGYLVDNTSDSGEGALLIEKNKYDVCLIDYKMKGLTGIDLLKMIKNKNPRCVAFIITGMPDIDILSANENLGSLIAGIVNKPFDIELLFKKIKDNLKR